MKPQVKYILYAMAAVVVLSALSYWTGFYSLFE